MVECLDSVVNQTLKDIEIICINDGSSDSSGKIIDEYASKDKRIKVIHKKNTGYGNSMNIGLDNSEGEYIGIVEPDDYIKLDMYETLYNKAKEDNLDLIKADFCRFLGEVENRKFKYQQLDSSKTYYDKIINPQEDLNTFNFIMNTWSGIYKREFIEKYNIRHNETPGASFQDIGFWFQTFTFAKRIEILNEPFYMNRRDNPNSSVKSKEKVFAMKHEYDFIVNILAKYPKVKDRLMPIFNHIKFNSYICTYKRIDIKYKKMFLDVFLEEFKSARKNKELDESLFSKEEIKKLNLIIEKPKLFYLKTLYKYFKHKIYRKEKDFGEKTFYLFDRKVLTVKM